MVNPVHCRGNDDWCETAFEPSRKIDIAMLKSSSYCINGPVRDNNRARNFQGHDRKRQNKSDDGNLKWMVTVTGANIKLAVGVMQCMAAPQDWNAVQQPMHPISLQIEDQHAEC